jgi:putative membrane protein
MAQRSCSQIFLIAAVAMATPVAMAQSALPSTAPSASGAHASHLAQGDASFLKQAAENGNAEVESSKLAVTKATNDKVRAFAQQMIDDHTKAGNELKALANAKGVEVSSEPSLMQQGKLKLLSTADGAKFDQEYANEMGVKAHEDTVKLFEKASREAKDPQVKAWAAKTLPTLKTHLEHARALKAGVGKS